MAEMEKLIKADLVLRIADPEKKVECLASLKKLGFSVDCVTDVATSTQYFLLRCNFRGLCWEAEKMKLQMPLKDAVAETAVSTCQSIEAFIEDHFVTDKEEDFISAPFVHCKGDKFHDFGNEHTFFRPSLRSLLAHRIISEYNAKKSKAEEVSLKDCLIPHAISFGSSCSSFAKHSNHSNEVPEADTVTSSNDYKEYAEMEQEWASFKNCCKFQPLWKIRNYFGEKIAFYFAWIGFFITSLWIPVVTGLIVFFYGVGLRAGLQTNGTRQANGTEGIKVKLFELMNFIHLTFDNDATPFFAMLVCIWGTLFLEFWKRKSATLAFEWDVKDLHATEPDRQDYHEPESSGISKTLLQCGRISISVAVALLMVAVVVASVVGVVIYKITLRIDVCPGYNEHECLILTTIMSSFLNAISITILGKLYKYVAVWLTRKENHKSQSKHDDALIIKLFAFQFANSYSSCFYIAFMLERVDMSTLIGQGGSYKDSCLGTCMSQLTFQVIALMIAKSLIKFLHDVVWPTLKQCCRWCKSNIIGPNQTGTDITNTLRREWEKPELDDFTLGEYTEKVIQYGYLMLFAASFPLAPLVAMVMSIVDLRVDGKRTLHVYRRPLACVAKDIGIWYSILTFLNFVAVISNACLVAFTSSWAQGRDLLTKVIIAVVFEHIVFVLKYILAFMIPDVPASVNESIRKEKDVHQRVFQADGGEENSSSV